MRVLVIVASGLAGRSVVCLLLNAEHHDCEVGVGDEGGRAWLVDR